MIGKYEMVLGPEAVQEALQQYLCRHFLAASAPIIRKVQSAWTMADGTQGCVRLEVESPKMFVTGAP